MGMATNKALHGHSQKEVVLDIDELIFFRNIFMTSTTYCLRTRIVHQGMNTLWSDEAEFKDLFDFHLNLNVAQNTLCIERNLNWGLRKKRTE